MINMAKNKTKYCNSMAHNKGLRGYDKRVFSDICKIVMKKSDTSKVILSASEHRKHNKKLNVALKDLVDWEF